MAMAIRRLGPGDERVLELLTREASDFGLAERGEPLTPLGAAAATRYLGNPAVVHSVAVEDGEVVGDLACVLLPLRYDEGQELLLYDIGVRRAWRRRGLGRALLSHMESWMRENGVAEVWVLADPEAVDFYRACGFASEEPQPVYMTRSAELDPGPYSRR